MKVASASAQRRENSSAVAGETFASERAAVAAEFDRLRQIKKLKQIGRADLLAAGVALAHRAILATRNLRHFREVSGLRLENWAD